MEITLDGPKTLRTSGTYRQRRGTRPVRVVPAGRDRATAPDYRIHGGSRRRPGHHPARSPPRTGAKAMTEGMSSTSSPASADLASASSEPECEPSPSARSIPTAERVLARHWPTVPVWGDVRTLTARWLMANAAWRCDVPNARTSGGQSGERAGTAQSMRSISSAAASPARTSARQERAQELTGARSGLWSEYARIIGEVRPRYVIVENVAALQFRRRIPYPFDRRKAPPRPLLHNVMGRRQNLP